MVEELKAQKVFDNTIIIVMADNGRPFPRAKTLLYEDGIMTPFIISYPKGMKNKGIESNSLISVIDIAPTLIELAGAKTSQTFQGRSFSKLLKEPGNDFRQYVFAEHNWHVSEAYERMVATKDYLLIENKRTDIPLAILGTPTGKSLKKRLDNNKISELQYEMFFKMPRNVIELYDRKGDSDQIKNIAKENPKKVSELLKVLRLWQDETGDTEPKYLKPNRSSKNVDYLHLVEMPGESKNAKVINNPGPF